MKKIKIFFSLIFFLKFKNKKNREGILGNNCMYVAASALPYHISGYTTRTHELISAINKKNCVNMLSITRPGYPWDRVDSLKKPESDMESTKFDGVIYKHLKSKFKQKNMFLFSIEGFLNIARVAKEENVKLIHAASNHMNALPALLAAKSLGIPFFYEMRGLWELSRVAKEPKFYNSYKFRLGLALEAFVASQADHVFVISEQMKKYVMEEFRIESSKISLLPNCVDLNKFSPPEFSLSKDTAFFETKKVVKIAYVGSLLEYEGVDVLLRAVAMLQQRGVCFNLKIAGDGEVKENLKRLSVELGIDTRVDFLGKIMPEEAKGVIVDADLICIPRKPYDVCKIVPPIKLVEALAMGKPVVIPDLPVFCDELGLNTEIAAGAFFRAGDPVDLARVIEHLIKNPEKMRELSLRARAHVEKNRDWNTYIENLLKKVKSFSS